MTESRWLLDDTAVSAENLEALNTIDDVGISIDVVDPKPDHHFLLHKDRHGTTGSDSVVLWFETEDDFHAFGEVTSRAAEDEFGCDWAYIYPTGLRAEFITGQFAAAVPRRDLKTVAALMRRELAGEFALTPQQSSRRRAARWSRRICLLTFLALYVQFAFFHHQFTGWGWVGMASAGIGWTMATIPLRNPQMRVHLDAIRARAAVAS